MPPPCSRTAAFSWPEAKTTSETMASISTLAKFTIPQRLDDIAHCPTQFQQYINGTDYRVHVVGNQVFGCEIASAADDYRYPQDAPTSLSACEVPPQIADQCRQVSRSLNLPVTGIDLRRTPAGEWYCFEVNPSPGFSFYEEATGQPISDAIADLLLLRVN